MAKKNEYYSYDAIDATNANYRIIIGERSNGKTYGFKLKCFNAWLENGEQFAYLRRFAEEILTKRVNHYWDDLLPYINEACAAVWPDYDGFQVSARTGEWTLYGCYGAKRDPLGVLGYYFSLNQTIYDKSVSYPNVTRICFEEFLTNKLELNDEFTTFINFVSTVKRKRTNMVVYLLGNTVNRNSQILEAMNINIRDLTQGEIKSYSYIGEDNTINTVAIEWCRHYEQETESESFFIFGHQQENMIIKGQWETKAYRLMDLGELYADYRTELGVILDNKAIRLYCYVLVNKRNEEEMCLYVTNDRIANRIEYITLHSEQTVPKRKTFCYLSNNKVVKRIVNLLDTLYRDDLVYYKDYLDGSDFENLLYGTILNKII